MSELDNLKSTIRIDPPEPEEVGSLRSGEPELVAAKPEPEETKIDVRVPIYGRAWFAVVVGSLTSIGGVLSLLKGSLSYIGAGLLLIVGPFLTWAGLKDGGINSGKSEIDRLLSDILRLIKELFEALIKKLSK